MRRYPRRMVDALAESNVALARRLRDADLDQPAHGPYRLVLLGRKTASERMASFLLEMVGAAAAIRAHRFWTCR